LAIDMPAAEELVFSFAAGVLLFMWGMFLAGVMGMFRPAVALVWPAILLLLGGRRPWLLARDITRQFREREVSWAERLATGFGALGLAMIYLTVLTPANVGFDSQWYHLPIAEHYVAAGAIVPFQEGWFLGTYPHLASIVYGWGFLLPGTTLFDRVLIAAHLEFVFFLATLASIPVLVHRLIPGATLRASWAALFLFPGIFLYDGSLFVAADHVLAFWAIPIYLAWLRAAREPSIRKYVLWSIVLAGALLTKYQAMYLLLPAATAFAYAEVRAMCNGGMRSRLPIIATTLAMGALFTVPHWLPNWWWYGDPFYPYLRHHLHAHPFTPSTMHVLESALENGTWRPTGTAFSKLSETLRALVTFSFMPHDWATYHGSVPVFGSLFTVASLLVPALRRWRPIGHLVVCTLAGIGVWYLTFHQDRYLQALLPWMVCATVAIAHNAWIELPVLRPLIVAVTALQIVWGGDVYFMPANDDSHELNRPSPIVAAVELLASGYRDQYEKRLHPYEPWETIGASLPPHSKLLLHERYLHLGLGAMSVSDLPGYQGGISYEDDASPKGIATMLSGYSVTHVLWQTNTSHGQSSLAADLAFFRFATQFTRDRQSIGQFTVARIAGSTTSMSSPDLVAFYECRAEKGKLRRLQDFDEGPDIGSVAALGTVTGPPPEATFVVIERDCANVWPSAKFEHMVDRGPYQLWTRRSGSSRD
jgi:hypothetical protein